MSTTEFFDMDVGLLCGPVCLSKPDFMPGEPRRFRAGLTLSGIVAERLRARIEQTAWRACRSLAERHMLSAADVAEWPERLPFEVELDASRYRTGAITFRAELPERVMVDGRAEPVRLSVGLYDQTGAALDRSPSAGSDVRLRSAVRTVLRPAERLLIVTLELASVQVVTPRRGRRLNIARAALFQPDDVTGRRMRSRSDVPQVHDPLDAWLVSHHPCLTGIADNLVGFWEALEKESGARRRREADRENLKVLVKTVLANLAFAVVRRRPSLRIAVNIKATKQCRLTRYDRRGFGQLPAVLQFLYSSAIQLLTFCASPHVSERCRGKKGRPSTIEPTAKFIAMLGEWGVVPAHFGRLKHAETIVLERRLRWDGRRIQVDYQDCEAADRARRKMGRINIHLHTSAPACGLQGESQLADQPAFGNCHLERRFVVSKGEDVPRFDLGGHLHGGWWQTEPEQKRITIHGERCERIALAPETASAEKKREKTDPEADLRKEFAVSETIMAAMLACAEAGIVALPLKDGLLVAKSRRRATEIMLQARNVAAA